MGNLGPAANVSLADLAAFARQSYTNGAGSAPDGYTFLGSETTQAGLQAQAWQAPDNGPVVITFSGTDANRQLFNSMLLADAQIAANSENLQPLLGSRAAFAQAITRILQGQVIIVGHSLGGTEADYAGVMLSNAGYNASVVTFDSPGLPPFASSIVNSTYDNILNIATVSDPVTNGTMLIGNTFPGSTIFLNAGSDPSTIVNAAENSVAAYAAGLTAQVFITGST